MRLDVFAGNLPEVVITMAGGDTVKRSHFVPQSYLKRFSNERKQVYVFDKTTKRSFPSLIGNVASKKSFYDMPEWAINQPSDKQKLEKDLSVFEIRWSKAIDSLLARADRGYREPILDQEKPTLAQLLLMQRMRTPLHRDVMKQMIYQTNGVVDAITRKYRATSPEGYPIELTDDVLQAGQVDAIYDVKSLIQHTLPLLRHIWVLIENTSNMPFYTSDSPVAMRGHLGFVGIAEEGIEIAFPLNPKYLLVLLDRTAHRKALPFENRRREIGSESVGYYNYLQVTDCHRHVYSLNDDFTVAGIACEEMPHVRSMTMTRVVVTSPLLE